MATATRPRIGCIGLGTMGGRVVQRLLHGGYRPVVFDVAEEAVARAAAAGAAAAASVAEVAVSSDVIFTSLPMPADVEAVYAGPNGAFQHAAAGQVFVDLSTIDPATARRVADAAPPGTAFLDAPVSGGPEGAERGALTVMVGGEAGAVDSIRSVLAAFSSRVIHVGPVGAGSVVKLANQLLVGANTIAAMEVASFAALAGVAPDVLLQALSVSAGDSVMLRRSIGDVLLPGDYSPRFALRLLVKDLRLYLEQAQSLGAATPAGGPALALFSEALALGMGGEDYAAIVKLIGGGETARADDAGDVQKEGLPGEC